MTVNPAIIALLVSALLVSLMLLGGAWFAVGVLRHWDLASGSERQLRLERRTYLVSTLLVNAFAFELGSLLLFVYMADALYPLFVGAMCAAGVLYANAWGYPALGLKAVLAVLAGVWLVMNHADNRSPLYPLVRAKYALLLVIVPLALVEAGLLVAFLTNLRADVITSCCGTLFSLGGSEVSGEVSLALLGALPVREAMYASAGAALALGAVVLATGRGAVLYGLLSLGASAFGLAGVIVHVSPYVYELPTHHCPFCLIQPEYHYVGYPLYAALFGSAIAGLGAGVLGLFSRREGMAEPWAFLRPRLVGFAMACQAAFALLSAWLVLSSNLVIQ